MGRRLRAPRRRQREGAARDAGRAYALSTEAGDIAERFGGKDLRVFAWAGRGQALIALGETARGVAASNGRFEAHADTTTFVARNVVLDWSQAGAVSARSISVLSSTT